MATRAASIERIGLGLAALGRPAYINVGREELPADRSVDAMRSATWRVLDEAYAAGVRWVDVARSYGRAEEFLAGWLTERGPAGADRVEQVGLRLRRRAGGSTRRCTR